MPVKSKQSSICQWLQWKKITNPAVENSLVVKQRIILSFPNALSQLKPEPILFLNCYYSLKARISSHPMTLNIPFGTQRNGASFISTSKHSLCLDRYMYVLKNVKLVQKIKPLCLPNCSNSQENERETNLR